MSSPQGAPPLPLSCLTRHPTSSSFPRHFSSPALTPESPLHIQTRWASPKIDTHTPVDTHPHTHTPTHLCNHTKTLQLKPICTYTYAHTCYDVSSSCSPSIVKRKTQHNMLQRPGERASSPRAMLRKPPRLCGLLWPALPVWICVCVCVCVRACVCVRVLSGWTRFQVTAWL